MISKQVTADAAPIFTGAASFHLSRAVFALAGGERLFCPRDGLLLRQRS